MTEREKLLRDIQGLRESIELNRAEVTRPDITGAERRAIIKHGVWCMQELAKLIADLNALDLAPPRMMVANSSSVQ
jgi:hypothetical protein